MTDYNVAYIVSSPRSGSTFLDNTLASHPEVISLGEVHQLPAYVLEDRQLYNPMQPLTCTCGAKVSNCSFWLTVQRELDIPLAELVLRPALFRRFRRTLSKKKQLLLWFPAKAVLRFPAIYRNHAIQGLFEGDRIGSDSFQLFDAVHNVTGARCIVDSSKSPFRLLHLYRHRPRQAKIIVLCRDYRAVAYSQMKRGHSLRASIDMWVKAQRNICALIRDVPASSILRLKHEHLCATPELAKQELWRFLDIDQGSIVKWQAIDAMHHLGGSPSKRQNQTGDIRLDTEYLGAMSPKDLRMLKRVAAPYAKQWGYD